MDFQFPHPQLDQQQAHYQIQFHRQTHCKLLFTVWVKTITRTCGQLFDWFIRLHLHPLPCFWFISQLHYTGGPSFDSFRSYTTLVHYLLLTNAHYLKKGMCFGHFFVGRDCFQDLPAAVTLTLRAIISIHYRGYTYTLRVCLDSFSRYTTPGVPFLID